jgi:hypothetical protein
METLYDRLKTIEDRPGHYQIAQINEIGEYGRRNTLLKNRILKGQLIAPRLVPTPFGTMLTGTPDDNLTTVQDNLTELIGSGKFAPAKMVGALGRGMLLGSGSVAISFCAGVAKDHPYLTTALALLVSVTPVFGAFGAAVRDYRELYGRAHYIDTVVNGLFAEAVSSHLSRNSSSRSDALEHQTVPVSQ